MNLGRIIRTTLGPLALSALLITGCSGDDGTGNADQADASQEPTVDQDRRQQAVDVVAEALVEVPRALYRTDDEPHCVSEELVERFGMERLEALGLDIESGTGPDLFLPGITEPERDEVSAAYDACLDMQARDIEAFTADGLTEEQALCVSRAYRASGIPRSHTTEPPHSNDLTSETDRVREAHALLDQLLTIVKASCQAWIPPGTSPGPFCDR